MSHEDLLKIALSAHGAILVGLIAAFYKYGDRTDIHAKSLAGTDSALRRLRMVISDDLLYTIKNSLTTDSTNPQPILRPDGKSFYSEKPANFLESDTFRQSIRDFMDQGADNLADYRVLLRARDRWCFWTRMLSWAIYSAAIFQVLCLVIHGLVDRCYGVVLPNWCAHGTLSISSIMILFIIGLVAPIVYNHDLILCQKGKYDAP